MDRVDYQPLAIQDLLNLSKRKELDLNPWYQRRAVWNRPQKSYLINTIFEQKPVPTIYIRHSINIEDERSIKEVVDGQQRIRSILEYIEGGENAFAARHPEHKAAIKYTQLTVAQKEKLRMTSLSVGYLMGATESDVIEIFGRLNSISKTLNLQEKRNARFSGAFKQFCLKQGSLRLPIWRDLGIFSATDISRMTEIQFTSELALAMIEGLNDFSTTRLDKIYKKYDEGFADEAAITRRMERVFSRITEIDRSAIKDTIFSRSPLFYSLFLILDSFAKLPSKTHLVETLYAIDDSFNADIPMAEREQDEAEFVVACNSSTQRIKSRKTRDTYIRKRLAR